MAADIGDGSYLSAGRRTCRRWPRRMAAGPFLLPSAGEVSSPWDCPAEGGSIR